MDFALIPFNSALNRLGELLPIGTFIRLRTVAPRIEKVALPKKRCHSICIRNEPTEFLAMTFTEPLDEDATNDLTVKYGSAEAILNDGPVECDNLVVECADGVPAEAITCSGELFLDLATPAVLPFLACGARVVSFNNGHLSEAFTLATVIPHLRPEVEQLNVLCRTSGNAANIVLCEPPLNQEVRLFRFDMHFEKFEQLIEWLQANAHAMAHRRFCKRAVLCCYTQSIRSAKELALLLSAALPYNRRPSNRTESSTTLDILFCDSMHTFYFTP